MEGSKLYVSKECMPLKILRDTKANEEERVDVLDKFDDEILENEYSSRLEKELILKNKNFNRDVNLLQLNYGGNLIKNKAILSKRNVVYLSSHSSILLIDLKKKKKKRIVLSFDIDRIFYFYDKKYKEEYLIIKGMNNYIYIYRISKNKYEFVKKFFIKNLFYINSFGNNGELCFATWEINQAKMYTNFFLLRFIFEYESYMSENYPNNLKNKNDIEKEKYISTLLNHHIIYSYESDSECNFDNKYFPSELYMSELSDNGFEYNNNNNNNNNNNTLRKNPKNYDNNMNNIINDDKQKNYNHSNNNIDMNNDYIHVLAKLKIKPILKIKYIYFSMIDLNKKLNKLVLSNNNIIIIYDLERRSYNIISFRNYISSIKISDDNFLAVGFINGYIHVILFEELLSNNENNKNKQYEKIFNSMKPFHMYPGTDSLKTVFPYIGAYEVDYMKSHEVKLPPLLNIPYINFDFNKNKIINIYKFHLIKYKWHSHSVYNLEIDGRKIISWGEEAVILFYDIDKASYEFISHLGFPCYYIYLNKEKNLIICNSLNNSLIFINYNHRLFFYKYNGINMPLSLKNLFYHYTNVDLNIKNSMNLFMSQINDEYDYTGNINDQTIRREFYKNEHTNNNLFNNTMYDDNINNFANCQEYSTEDSSDESSNESNDLSEVEDIISSNNKNKNEFINEETNKYDDQDNNRNEFSKHHDEDNENVDDNKKMVNIKKRKKEKRDVVNLLSFRYIEKELEKKLFKNSNVENNLYKKYQMCFYCDSNKGLIFCFLTSFSHLQLYNIEKDKHEKYLCSLNMTYKSRTNIEKVNDMELIFFCFNHNRNLLMTIEKRNYLMPNLLDSSSPNLTQKIYTIKFWLHDKDLEYNNIYEYAVPCNMITYDGQETNDVFKAIHVNINKTHEKYQMIKSHPFLNMFLLFETNGNISIWCFDKSEKIFDECIYDDYVVDCVEMVTENIKIMDRMINEMNNGTDIHNIYKKNNNEHALGLSSLNNNNNNNNNNKSDAI
ncbi:hypothetical protein C923_03455 [Plasmodium falciparum UGT5.1]|uniref:Uncharacterized protein n=1 Tax=Plasmodium falciparum UGT5.1 TaxID=1237627 RepID=W7JWF5_PLAFA|nr:hypothetical protein C923_03455 [Plasmodium falciparum UGT5.1]